MDIQIKGFVAAIAIPYVPPGIEVPGAPQIDFERLTHVFNELARLHHYLGFQASGDGKSAQITGATPADVVAIQPPILQFQVADVVSPEKSAEQAQSVFQVLTKHLQIGQILQVSMKWLAQAPMSTAVPGKDFVIEKIFGKSPADFATLSLGVGGGTWVGAKFVATDQAGTTTYASTVEPLIADELKSLYLETDATFLAGNLTTTISERALGVLQYLQESLKTYLEHL